MKGTGAAIKVGITAILVAVVGWIGFKFVAKGINTGESFEVWALFKDATGLVEKSRVQIAGLVVGELRGRSLYYDQGTHTTLAKVNVGMRPDIVLWSNAAIYKRSASLLGEFYLEIDPGTPESPDPVTGKAVPNYPLKGCVERTHDPGCNQIRNVIEAITTTDVLVQVNETLPVLRDILRDVHHLTQGPLQDIAKEVQSGVKTNSLAAEKLIAHIDQIAQDLHNVTSTRGPLYDDLKTSMDNIRNITESVKGLVGTGEGQVTTTGDKLKKDLDQLSVTLDKLNHSIDQVSDMAERVSQGEGTVGKLLTDDTIAKNIGDITEDASGFVRSITRLQTLVDVREEYNILGGSFKTYLGLKLMPRPDKFYMIELVDDPRGSRTFTHTLQYANPATPNQPAGPYNLDTWTRSSAFRFSFMFGKRIPWRGVGFTGRIGIKESTGGAGVDFDFWRQRFVLKIDAFDFVSETWPRLKVAGALELPFLKHFWVLGGVDDIINGHSSSAGPPGVTCGPTTPSSWCQGGRDFFVGLQLSFNDEDLRSLLTIGGSALGGAAGGAR